LFPKLLIDLLHPSTQSLPPPERLVLEAADDLEARMQQLVRRKVPLAPVPALEPPPNELDVLL
jgi:hypothetical protein